MIKPKDIKEAINYASGSASKNPGNMVRAGQNNNLWGAVGGAIVGALFGSVAFPIGTLLGFFIGGLLGSTKGFFWNK